MTKTMGLGYRAPFFQDLMAGQSDIGWIEVITENFLWDQGVRWKKLASLREKYELSCHGVSLSLAAPEKIDFTYLDQLKKFCQDFAPVRVSDHLCWSSLGGHNWHDLLPFPYSEQNLKHITEKVLTIQERLKRPLVLENLSAYIQSAENEMSEYAFLAELCRRTDCEILLDVNNMIVNARNFKIDPYAELEKIDLKKVAQVHLAGFTEGEEFVVDTHSEPPHEDTWRLWKHICEKRRDIPFMIEWDSDIPEFSEVKKFLDRAAL